VTASFVIAPLSPNHDKPAFSCGVDPLDRYLQTQAPKIFAVVSPIAL